MIAVIDYNVGNLFSVYSSLSYLGIKAQITRDPSAIRKADGIILPGVGAFADAMGELEKTGLVALLKQQATQKPFLGICLGMQLLFETGYEFGQTPGLGLIPGTVEKMAAQGLKLPHMGWNALRFVDNSPLLDGVDEGSYVYFVHSFMANTPRENIAAVADYGNEVPALVQLGHVFGAQFHPEKSGEAGLTILKNFGRLAG